MSKQARPRDLDESQAQAIARNLRVSPRKLNLVAELIRGLPAGQARATLTFSKRRIAKQVCKVLDSAIANAENNHALDVDRLVVDTATVGRSIVMKRFHARGRGRASRVEKWFSHLTIVVRQKDAEAKAARPPRRRRPEPRQPEAKQEAA
ncbi:MAG: 50S ribosomal protein L22 [Acetobacteraceae bacterium]|nr:50S ribosomal protein L22 [Acetobacteraceae bacterium]